MGLKDVEVLPYERRGPTSNWWSSRSSGECAAPAVREPAQVKERPLVHYIDLPVYGTPMRLVLEKAPDALREPGCTKSWVLERPPDRGQELPAHHQGGQMGDRQVGGGRTVKRWPPSWPVTGTRSTTP